MNESLQQRIECIFDTVISYRRHMHRHPELSGQEQQTSAWIAEQCYRHGLDVRTDIGGYGLLAALHVDPSLPWLALRADMDALPIEDKKQIDCISLHEGISHACGHDAHSAMLLGAIIVLSGMRTQLPCNITFIFQPAEETCSGATAMLHDGVFADIQPDHIFALHVYPHLPSGSIGMRHGVMCAAADLFEVEIRGRGGHAARPHECTDVILIASHVIQALHHIISRRVDSQHPAVLTIGEIHSGHAANVLPDHVRFSGTVRTLNPDAHETIRNQMIRIIRQTAESWGATATFTLKQACPILHNDEQAMHASERIFSQYLPDCELITLDAPSMGGEDFAEFLADTPGALFRLGTGAGPDTRYPLHHPCFNIDETAMRHGIAALCALALGYPHLKKGA